MSRPERQFRDGLTEGRTIETGSDAPRSGDPPAALLFLCRIADTGGRSTARGADVRDIPLSEGFNLSGSLDDNRTTSTASASRSKRSSASASRAEVTFVAKSVGTMILGAIGARLSVPGRVNALWLTPAFPLDYVRDGAVADGMEVPDRVRLSRPLVSTRRARPRSLRRSGRTSCSSMAPSTTWRSPATSVPRSARSTAGDRHAVLYQVTLERAS